MSAYVSLGADKSKLILGIPFYGQSFTTSIAGSERSGHGPGTPALEPGKPGQWTNQPGMLAYYEICQNVKSGGWSEGGDNYAYHPASHQWVGYDSVAGVRAKAEYVVSQGFGGVSVSTLDLDDFNNLCCGGQNPLLTSISSVLLGTPAPAAGCGRPKPPVTPSPRPQASTEPWDDGGSYSTEKTTWGPASTTTTAAPTSRPPTTAPTTAANGGATAAAAECVENEFIQSAESCQQYYRCINGKKELHSCAGIYRVFHNPCPIINSSLPIDVLLIFIPLLIGAKRI